MINFMRDDFSDGGVSYHENVENNDDGGRGLVLGLGQAGIQILDQMVMRGEMGERSARAAGFEFLALDADQATIDGSVVGEKRLLGKPLLRGLGSFGDRARARAVWRMEKEAILERLDAIDQLVIVVGLGGGTGTVLAVEIAQAFRGRSRGGRLIVVAALPFSFEADSRRAEAVEALAGLRAQADAVLTLSNDRAEAWPNAPENLRHGVHGLNLSLAHGVEVVTQILAVGGLNPLSFADLRGLFGRLEGSVQPENCWIARAESEPGDDAMALVERVLANPLLSHGAAWEKADRCLACLVGGADFSVSQLQAVSKAIEAQLPPHISVSLGTRTAERFEGRLALSLMLAATRKPEQTEVPAPAPAAPALFEEVVLPIADAVLTPIPRPLQPAAEQMEMEVGAPAPEPEIAAEPKRKTVPVPVAIEEIAPPTRAVSPAKAPRRRSKPGKQEELPFEAANSGRFENSFETIHKGENLDQPTFRRRRLVIQA